MKNFVQEDDNILLTVGSGVSAGDAVVVGQIPAVAITDADSNNQAACRVNGVFSLATVAEDNAGASAIAEGDLLYIDGSELNKDNVDGVLFGYALQANASGENTINVRLAK